LSEAENERAWAQGARAGSAADFSRLVRAHQQTVRGFLRRLTGHHADADDLAQEAFVFAWEHIGRFDPARSFRPWLFGIAWRKYCESKRGRLRRTWREDRLAAEAETVTNPDPSVRLDVAAALGTLPPEQRAALLLCLMEQFTYEEAAAALALPPGTVKSHVARGRDKLTAILGGPNG
jgi:RNA polymerase sigma factor (sigma-70 family)